MAEVIVESTANGSTATGWQTWPAPRMRWSDPEVWCWSAHVNGESRSGEAPSMSAGRAMAEQAYAALQDGARRRTLRSV